MELTHIKGKTYYLKAAVNLGLYVEENGDAILIDSGGDKEAGREILKILKEKGWNLRLIINTHSNADHIGGNAYLVGQTGCKIATTSKEACFTREPSLEPSFLFGGFPLDAMRNHFLQAKESQVDFVLAQKGKILDTQLEAFPLPGHFFEMFGIRTPDNVVFLADSVLSEDILNKYAVCFLYDVKEHIKTLESLKAMIANDRDKLGADAASYVPCHATLSRDPTTLIDFNIRKVKQIADEILAFCEDNRTAEDVLAMLVAKHALKLNETQYALLMCTTRSYLSYLANDKLIAYSFVDGKMQWKRA